MNNRRYYHRSKQFFMKSDIYELLRQMTSELDDKKFVEILLVAFIGSTKIKFEELDWDAFDLISSMYSFIHLTI